VSTGQENVDVATIEQTRRQIQRLFEEVSRLSELDLLPADFFGEYLKRVLTALAAPAGAIWMRTPQGNLQLQYQINLQNLGLNRSDEARQSHEELLRGAFQHPRPLHLPPHSSSGPGENGQTAPGNPTDLLLLLVPIQVENQVDGLLEVWQDPNRNPAAVNGFLQFMVEMAQLGSRYLRNRMMRQMAGQQSLWTQLESFSRQIHTSLNPVETSYIVANEGRRLIDCDRVSIGLRYARKVRVEAVSGADVVERRSSLVQLMQKLFDRVIKWGEKLVYTGSKEEGLPPDVLEALNEYLAESNSKLLVVMPLKDEREKDSKRPIRAVVMMECFEPQASSEQLLARLDVVSKHATSALYNAIEHRRIPFRFVWLPLAKVQEGLGGQAQAIAWGIAIGVVLLVAGLIFIPWQLRMEAMGQLQPVERVTIYPPSKGTVVPPLAIKHGARVPPGANIIKMEDPDLVAKIVDLNTEIDTAKANLETFERDLQQLKDPTGGDQSRFDLESRCGEYRATLKNKTALRDRLKETLNIIPNDPGRFWIKAPSFPETRLNKGDAVWTVLTPDFEETLKGRQMEPKDPMIRLGYKEGPWEIEAKIPQKHIGQVVQGFDYVNKKNADDEQELDVEIVVRSAPTKTYLGKLARSKVALQADPHRDDNNEPEPVVLARIRIDGDDIPENKRIPIALLLTGSEVRTKVLCGKHAAGYSLFYGVWEFLYEKVVFFF
jgi:hypothetical protein